MRTPTQVEVKGSKRRRRGKIYADRPTVSSPIDERLRDSVADLDRVTVGFAEAHAPALIRRPVFVRAAEHARSPYVVSLRGLALAPATMEHERISMADLSTHSELPFMGIPNLESVAVLASDLCVDGTEAECGDQFTASTFQSSFSASYGGSAALFDRLWAFFSWLASLLPTPKSEVSEPPTPAEPPVSSAVPSAKLRSRKTAQPIAFQMSWNWSRTAVGMGLLLAAATLPANAVRLARSFGEAKSAVVSAGALAIGDVKAAAAAPLPEGAEGLRRASAHFRAANDALDSTSALAIGLAGLVPQSRSAFQTAKALTEIGEKTSQAGERLATGFATALAGNAGSPIDRLHTLSAYAEGALPLLDDASAAFERVNPSFLPEDRRADAETLKEVLEQGRTAVREFTGLAALMAHALGQNEPRRYLLVFQNPSELRPTGGFMGSFAEVTLDRGEIASLSVPPGGTYALQGDLIARVAPPDPLRLISERWEFQDSNWSPDFPTAAKKVLWFWSKAGGPTMDGMIAVNATLVEKLLALTGPIDVPELGKTLNAENFMLETQKAVEIEYDREENQPKKILGLLAPRLLEKLKALPEEESVKAMAILSEALATKEIQVSFANPEEEALARRFGWSGEFKETNGDALAIIDANVAGQKTDLSVRERVTHTAAIAENGTIEDTVVMTREHTASKGELFRGVRNVSYVRFYVPRGSTLLRASGFTTPDPSLFDPLEEGLETDPDEAAAAVSRTRHASGIDVWDEGSRTVFGGWSMVDPGQTATLSVAYRLPFSAFDLRSRLDAGPLDGQGVPRAAYSLLLTSQSGKTDRTITSTLAVPASWQAAWTRGLNQPEHAWDRDHVEAALFDIPKE